VLNCQLLIASRISAPGTIRRPPLPWLRSRRGQSRGHRVARLGRGHDPLLPDGRIGPTRRLLQIVKETAPVGSAAGREIGRSSICRGAGSCLCPDLAHSVHAGDRDNPARRLEAGAVEIRLRRRARRPAEVQSLSGMAAFIKTGSTRGHDPAARSGARPARVVGGKSFFNPSIRRQIAVEPHVGRLVKDDERSRSTRFWRASGGRSHR